MKRDEPDVSGGLFDNWNKTFFGSAFHKYKKKSKSVDRILRKIDFWLFWMENESFLFIR